MLFDEPFGFGDLDDLLDGAIGDLRNELDGLIMPEHVADHVVS